MIVETLKFTWRLFVPQSIESKRCEMIDIAERNLFEAKRAKEDAQCIIDYNTRRLKNLRAEQRQGVVNSAPAASPSELLEMFKRGKKPGFSAVDFK